MPSPFAGRGRGRHRPLRRGRESLIRVGVGHAPPGLAALPLPLAHRAGGLRHGLPRRRLPHLLLARAESLLRRLDLSRE